MPSRAILLTFDDGFTDHFSNVFPLLDARHIQGCFFPPAQAILEHVVLDVHKIQFVLATVAETGILLDRVFEWLPELGEKDEVGTREFYARKMTEKHRYDPPEITMFKRLLQRELPQRVRRKLVDRLFAEYVTRDEAAFSAELYMSPEQLRCMARHGMHIGAHGYRHEWLNRLTPCEQGKETDLSLEFLDLLGIPRSEWTMCYPYGGFDRSLLDLLETRQCQLGFSVEPRVADLTKDGHLTLPRIDTNDLPV